MSKFVTKELIRARDDMELAWRLYHLAVERTTDQSVLVFQREQAQLYERRYKQLYLEIQGKVMQDASKD